MSTKFFEALIDISRERNVTIEAVLQKVETAMQIACKNSPSLPYNGEIKIDCDLEKKSLKFYNYNYVVKGEITDSPRGQISVEEAKMIKPTFKPKREYELEGHEGFKICGEFKTRVDLKLFKRKSAAIFKQNLLNELKGLEREEACSFFEEKVGEIINARVCAINDAFITFDLGKDVEATMGPKDMLPDEKYTVDDVLKVYISRVEKTGRGPKVFISRSSRDFVKKLFELNIPEVANGQIEIMAIARDAGKRSKVGVMSINDDIDAKGACVGAGGARIKAINQALNGEKIDIFVWKGNAVELISEALSPAKCLSVMANEEEKKAIVVVSDDQFSLAIGAKGQNARLAVLATGYKIDIKKLSDAEAEGLDFKYNVNND